MSEEGADLRGRVLQAISSTPNRGGDGERYQALVVEPTRQLRRRWVDDPNRDVEPAEARQLIDLLLGAFDAKQLAVDERRDRVREVLVGTCLEPELMEWLARVPEERQER